ncbi:hypothetical protein Fmac_009282 [Flemingia macrophylla]|uniref:Uncharacterized protein n=1 Tax=Flemingia macrophylla TaxID=520843 RepID=A0ABD1N0M0_9FABA
MATCAALVSVGRGGRLHDGVNGCLFRCKRTSNACKIFSRLAISLSLSAELSICQWARKKSTGTAKNLDAAVECFKLAGGSEANILMVLKNNCANGDAR